MSLFRETMERTDWTEWTENRWEKRRHLLDQNQVMAAVWPGGVTAAVILKNRIYFEVLLLKWTSVLTLGLVDEIRHAAPYTPSEADWVTYSAHNYLIPSLTSVWVWAEDYGSFTLCVCLFLQGMTGKDGVGGERGRRGDPVKTVLFSDVSAVILWLNVVKLDDNQYFFSFKILT